MEGKDPVKVIRDAIAKALVFYYPFAGRLREQATRKLVVECTGEGVMFIEADADVTLSEFGDVLQPPFPCREELLYDVPGSNGIINCPLLLIQVTCLKCGGFIFAIRHNHTMSDAAGLVQFMSAVSEFAQGAEVPSIFPVWERHCLNARAPPRVTCTHHEYDDVPETKGAIIPQNNMIHRSFFFGAAEISALRSHLPPHTPRCSTFELLTACIWRCRTIAISPKPNEVVRMLCVVNGRMRFNPPLVPEGYYGNVFVIPAAITTAENLSKNPLQYALELVKKLKYDVTEDYMKSVADLMVLRGRPHFTVPQSFVVSDVTHAGFNEIDFGWGKPVFAGPDGAGLGALTGGLSFYVPCRNKNGENGIMVPICLPADAMDVFAKELQKMLKRDYDDVAAPPLKSAL